MSVLLATVVLIAVGAEPVAAQTGWTTADGDARRTRVAPWAGPVNPDDGRWLLPLTGFHFPPIVWSDGTIYITSTNDVSSVTPDGTVSWKNTDDQFFSSPSLSSDGTTVYQSSRSGKVYALDASTGAAIWDAVVGGATAVVTSTTVSPDGGIYASSGSQLTRVNPDGSVAWSFFGGGNINRIAVADDGTIRFSDGQDLVSMSSAGTELWRVEPSQLGGNAANSAVIQTDGSVLLCSSRMVASISTAGSVNWLVDADCASMMLMDDGFVTANTRGLDGYDLDGNPLWSVTTELTRTFASADSRGTIYIAGDEPGILAFNRDGVPAWSKTTNPPVYSVVPAPDDRLLGVLYDNGSQAAGLISLGETTGGPGVTEVSRSVMQFNPASVGASEELAVTIRNIGSTTVTVSPPTVIGADAGAFTVNGSVGSLAPGASASVSITFSAPNAQPFFSADLEIVTGGLNVHHVELLGSVGIARLAKGGWPLPHGDTRFSGSSPYAAPDGTIAWQYCEGFTQIFSGLDRTPVARADGSVFVNPGANMLAHVSASGQLLAEIPGGTPIALRSDGVVMNGFKPMRAVTPGGNILWSAHGSLENAHGSHAIAPDGTIYYTTDNNATPRLVARSPAGAVLWESGYGDFNDGTDMGVMVANNGTIVVAGQNRVEAFDPSGNSLWTSRENARRPALTTDNVLVTPDYNEIRGLNVLTGETIWELTGLENNATGDVSIAPDGTIVSGYFILNSDGTLRATPWTRAWPVTISADGVAMRSEGQAVRAYDLTGQLLWSVTVATVVDQVALASDGRAYARGAGCLYAIGSAVTQQPAVALSSTSLDFGTVDLNDVVERSVTVSNVGTATVDVSSLTIVGSASAEYSITSPVAPFSITPSASVDVMIEFVASVAGSRPASLQITNNAPGSPHSVSLLASVTDPSNSAPEAVNDLFVVYEDEPASLHVLSNDFDDDGQPLTVAEVFGPSNGSATIVDDTTVVYVPVADFWGVDEFRYLATDGIAVSDTATVTLIVSPVNDPPVALDDAIFTGRNVAVEFDPRENDFDIDDTELAIFSVSTSQFLGGTSVTAGGVTYTPPPDFTGTDRFRYTISDVAGDTASAVVTVSVDIAQYAHTAIGAIGESGIATAINNNGVVVGASRLNDGTVHAWRWDDGVQDLLTLPGAVQSVAYDISDGNEIVGFALGGDSVGRGFMMDAVGVVTYFSTSSAMAIAYGINESGTVVGQVTSDDGHPEGFVFAPTPSMAHPSGVNASELFAINNAGVYVGAAYRADGASAPLIGANVLSQVGRVYAVTNNFAVGSLSDGISSTATAWQLDHTPSSPFGESGFGEAYGANEAGWIVGSVEEPSAGKDDSVERIDPALRTSTNRGTSLHERTVDALRPRVGKTSIIDRVAVLRAGTSTKRLAELTTATGWTLIEARDINERGDIVGWGTVSAGGQEQTQAFILSASGNTAPKARADEVLAAFGSVKVIRALDNDFDDDGDLLQIVQVGKSALGSVRITDDSTGLEYTAGWKGGIDSFSYVVSDGVGTSSTAEVRVVVGVSADSDRLQIVSSFPNPAYGDATIIYALPQPGRARLTLFDLLGRVVLRSERGEVTAGVHRETLDTSGLAPGTYLLHLNVDGSIDSLPVIVVR